MEVWWLGVGPWLVVSIAWGACEGLPVPLYTNSYEEVPPRPLFGETRLMKFLRATKSNYCHIVYTRLWRFQIARLYRRTFLFNISFFLTLTESGFSTSKASRAATPVSLVFFSFRRAQSIAEQSSDPTSFFINADIRELPPILVQNKRYYNKANPSSVGASLFSTRR